MGRREYGDTMGIIRSVGQFAQQYQQQKQAKEDREFAKEDRNMRIEDRIDRKTQNKVDNKRAIEAIKENQRRWDVGRKDKKQALELAHKDKMDKMARDLAATTSKNLKEQKKERIAAEKALWDKEIVIMNMMDKPTANNKKVVKDYLMEKEMPGFVAQAGLVGGVTPELLQMFEAKIDKDISPMQMKIDADDEAFRVEESNRDIDAELKKLSLQKARNAGEEKSSYSIYSREHGEKGGVDTFSKTGTAQMTKAQRAKGLQDEVAFVISRRGAGGETPDLAMPTSDIQLLESASKQIHSGSKNRGAAKSIIMQLDKKYNLGMDLHKLD